VAAWVAARVVAAWVVADGVGFESELTETTKNPIRIKNIIIKGIMMVNHAAVM